jgi:pimeloyl-ACP methyl ester carboxylesterase
MIHGVAANLRHYTATVFEQIARTNRAIAIDRPGSGYSGRPAGSEATTQAQAAIIQKALDKLGVADPLIVGHSLGGGVALAHAVHHPGKARGYVLLAPLVLPEQPRPPLTPPAFFALSVVRNLIAWTIASPRAIKNGPMITAFVFSPQAVPKDFATASGALLGLRPKAVVNTLKDFAAASATPEQIQHRLGEIKAPVICLYGTQDVVLHADKHLPPLEALPNRELQRLDGIGHMLMHVAPDAVTAAIRRLDTRTAESAGTASRMRASS